EAHMHSDDPDQPQPSGPQRHRHLTQERRVGVERLRSLKDLEISDHMKDDESGKPQARERHQDFATEGSEDVTEESDHELHAASFVLRSDKDLKRGMTSRTLRDQPNFQ